MRARSPRPGADRLRDRRTGRAADLCVQDPAPCAFFLLAGERFKILEAQVEATSGAPGTVLDEALLIGCGTGSIRPLLVQRAGKGAMAVADLLRGFPIAAGTSFDPLPAPDAPAA